jgi:hypothetical protein
MMKSPSGLPREEWSEGEGLKTHSSLIKLKNS